jgi:hypothetical protein
MATATLLANGGNDRLVVSTICTHRAFFHEAGFEYRTERKQPVPMVLWNPATWRGFQWIRTGEAEQPRGMRCTFNDGASPSDFDVTPQSSPGFFKSSCDYLSLRRHCVWVAVGDPAPSVPRPAVGNDARRVRDVRLWFTYDGRERALRHSAGGEP